MTQTTFAIIIPTLNGGTVFEKLLQSIAQQTVQPQRKLIIDSQSSDDTVVKACRFGWEVMTIDRKDFNHGGTRQLGFEQCSSVAIVVYLTQDAILAGPQALEHLINSFSDDRIGAAYGRQLPHLNCGPFGAHAREFNYPEWSQTKSFHDRSRFGIKTAFISNAFAAYRGKALQQIGGFPRQVILGEDTYVAAKMLIEGWNVRYCAEAQVYHSHDYSFLEELRRYFDTGVFHKREAWLRSTFGQAEGEGLRFVQSEIRYLLKNKKPYLLPAAFVRTCAKYLGYRLGTMEKDIPLSMKKKLSMHCGFW